MMVLMIFEDVGHAEYAHEADDDDDDDDDALPTTEDPIAGSDMLAARLSPGSARTMSDTAASPFEPSVLIVQSLLLLCASALLVDCLCCLGNPRLISCLRAPFEIVTFTR